MQTVRGMTDGHAVPGGVASDAVLIKRALGDRLCSLAVFGSAVRSGFADARDVDIALFMRDDSLLTHEAADRLSGLPLTFPLRRDRIQDDYSGGGGYMPQKEYHILIVRPARQQQFVERHTGRMVFV